MSRVLREEELAGGWATWKGYRSGGGVQVYIPTVLTLTLKPPGKGDVGPRLDLHVEEEPAKGGTFWTADPGSRGHGCEGRPTRQSPCRKREETSVGPMMPLGLQDHDSAL